jgi:ABC-type Fe3+ transport system substrate-binding protein
MAAAIGRSRLRRLAAGAVVLALLAPACGGDDDGEERATPATSLVPTPELQAVMDAAEGEGKLALSWAGVLGDIGGAPKLVEGFEDYYGLDVDVVFTPGSGQAEMAGKVEQELRAGLPATTDILSLTATGVLQYSQRGVLEAVDWASFAPSISDPRMIALDGVAVSVETWPMGIAYHTGRVRGDEVPTSMEDLLDPEYQGRIYTTPFGGGFDLLASDQGWGRDRTLAFVEEYVDQIGGLGFNVQPLLSGEFDIMALLVPPSVALKAKQEGAPIEFVVPSDAALFYDNLVAIPANSAHPNAARLFVNYLMSPEGQAQLRELDFVDSPLVPGSITADQVEQARAAGEGFVYGDIAFYQAQDPEQYAENAHEIVSLLRGQ